MLVSMDMFWTSRRAAIRVQPGITRIQRQEGVISVFFNARLARQRLPIVWPVEGTERRHQIVNVQLGNTMTMCRLFVEVIF